MKKAGFLNKLYREGKLGLAEPSEEIKESYMRKADNCMKSAKILLQNELYENSVTEAYYAMYNCLLALLYKAGIKSENHSASIVLLKELFRTRELYGLISSAKRNRIDKQYYVESEQKQNATRDSCVRMIAKTEDFMIGARLLIDRTGKDDIERIRADFQKILR